MRLLTLSAVIVLQVSLMARTQPKKADLPYIGCYEVQLASKHATGDWRFFPVTIQLLATPSALDPKAFAIRVVAAGGDGWRLSTWAPASHSRLRIDLSEGLGGYHLRVRRKSHDRFVGKAQEWTDAHPWFWNTSPRRTVILTTVACPALQQASENEMKKHGL